jgi:hypothetical protein
MACFSIKANSQYMYKPSTHEVNELPDWARKMYLDDANFYKVTQLYNDYYKKHPFVKTYHTKYYQRWKRRVQPFVQSDGKYTLPSTDEVLDQNRKHTNNIINNTNRSTTWSLLGPIQVFGNEGKIGHTQTNIYAIEQTSVDTTIMY